MTAVRLRSPPLVDNPLLFQGDIFMMFTKTLDDVREQVQSDDSGKWDSIVPCQQISLYQGRLVFPLAQADGYDEGMALTPWALSQACQRLGLPTAYFKKCPPQLQDQNFNYWNQSAEVGRQLVKADADPDGAWLLRSKGATVRGVLSSRYARLDNTHLLEALFPLLSGTRYQVGLVQLSSESLHLRLVDPLISRDVLPGDRLLVGIHVANSEVGLRAVTVDACVFRVVCTNGLIRRINNRSLLRQRHLHVSEPRFKEMLERAIGEAVTVAAAFIEQMALAIKTPIPDPEQALSVLADAWKLSQQTVEFVRFALYGESQHGQQDTLYGLVNALTNAAQRLSPDDRFELETLAGVLIDTTATASQADTALRNRLLKPSNGTSSAGTAGAILPIPATMAPTMAPKILH
jgi:hypothetical protein